MQTYSFMQPYMKVKESDKAGNLIKKVREGE